MSGLNSQRKRSEILNFRVSKEEKEKILTKITASRMPKGDYFIQSCLHQKVEISGGKFHSDRLSVELGKLRVALESSCYWEHLKEIKDLLEVLVEISSKPDNDSALD